MTAAPWGIVASMDQELLESKTRALLEHLGASIDTLEVVGSERKSVRVTSKDSKELIGPTGETLRALNHILRRLLEKGLGEEPRVANLLDVNGYFEQKNETVRANARMLAQRARLFKHDVELSPMSAYERMLIHELFAEDPEIKTESAGEGKFRHVVLKYVAGGKTLSQ